MENNQNSHPTKDICEKIYRAIAVSSPIRTIRRISNWQHENSPAKVPNPSLPASDPAVMTPDMKTKPVEDAKHLRLKTKQASEDIPVKSDYTTLPANIVHPSPSNGLGKEESKSKAKVASKIETPTSATARSVQDKHMPKHKPERIAPMKVNGEDKPVQHIEDRFTDYINRAKLKIRTMSNVGDGKSSQVADGGNKDHFSDYIRRAKLKLRTTSSMKTRSESFNSEGKRGA